MKYIAFILLLLLALMVSCRKEKTAENALIDFISYRFQENQSRDALLEKTHGRFKDLIAGMDEVEFKKFASVDRLQKQSFKIVLENCKADICFITYTLSYVDFKDDKKREAKFNIDVKKIAKIERQDENWLISDVQNVKTYINSKEKINITDKDILEKDLENEEVDKNAN